MSGKHRRRWIKTRKERSAWANFDDCYIPEPNTGCWLWERNLNPCGYGQLHSGITRKTVSAHRESYRRAFGEIADGLGVLHRCDMPACVNPEHLFLGTHMDNMRDRAAKGRERNSRGEANPRAKLTPDNVREIRKSTEPAPVLARRYGVVGSSISHIRTRFTWRDLD